MAATAFNVSSFKSKLSGGGARPALFEISWTDDNAKWALTTSSQSLLVKAASLPSSNIAPLVQNYAGRAYKLQGFRTFDPWVVTCINDETFAIRTKIKQWMEALSGKMDGTRDTITVSGTGPPGDTADTVVKPNPYASGTAIVTQLNQGGAKTKSYKFYNLWPTELAPIPLDWSSDMVEEFSITFAYDYWTTGKASTTGVNTTNQVNTGKPTGSGVPSSAS